MMSHSDTQKYYKWEWPADRTPDVRLLAKVTKLEKQKDGIFGIKKSPSFASSLPDAHILIGTVVDGDNKLMDQTFTLILPKVELGDISVRDHVALGLLGSDVCICIAKVPSGENRTKQMEWVANWKCTANLG